MSKEIKFNLSTPPINSFSSWIRCEGYSPPRNTQCQLFIPLVLPCSKQLFFSVFYAEKEKNSNNKKLARRLIFFLSLFLSTTWALIKFLFFPVFLKIFFSSREFKKFEGIGKTEITSVFPLKFWFGIQCEAEMVCNYVGGSGKVVYNFS